VTSAERWWSGQDQGWRYLARRIDGSGTPGEWLDTEVPLTDVTITDVLSGPPQISGTIEPVFARAKMADDRPLFTTWDTEIYAEADGVLRAGGLLVRNAYNGQANDVDVSGFAGYPKSFGYTGETSFVEADPLDVVRHIWRHIQLGERSNLGLEVADTITPVRIGKNPAPVIEGEETTTPTSNDDEPYRLAEWETDDLLAEIDELAKSTPFEYHERHEWNTDKTDVRHFLDLGYPKLGQRRDLRFVLGENIHTIPTVELDGEGFANHVRVLGAGEGSAMIRADAAIDDGRLRKMITVSDDSITEPNRARIRARRELAARSLLAGIGQVIITPGPMTPLGAWNVGDEIRVQVDGEGLWVDVDVWYRIISQTITPENPELVTATLLRSDRFL
jgi:hypothetical protein